MGDLIKAGTIQDRSGKNYWNLDESEVHLGPGAKLDGKDIAVADAVIASVDVEYAQWNVACHRAAGRMADNGAAMGVGQVHLDAHQDHHAVR